MAVDYKNNTKQ